MPVLLTAFALLSLLLTGAIFGFFYAWICSTMWGLDAAAPDVAIAAMQAMNASVRNIVFAPAFFGTPIVLAVTAFYAVALHRRKAAYLFVGAAVIYAVGCFGLTIAVNVPMNEALAAVDIPHDMQEAQQIWSRYSDPWKNWNVIRTVASGASLMSTGLAMLQLNPGRS